MIKKINYYLIAQSILIFLALISVSGATVYRLYSLNKIGVIISVLTAILIFIIIQRFRVKNKEYEIKITESETEENKKFIGWLFVIGYLFLILLSFYILFSSQTTNSILSPWEVIPSYFFITYTLATSTLIIIILNSQTIKQSNNLKIILISLHYFLSLSVALIIYKIGFGFDPFVHEATLNLINKTGSVDPKPFYYLGEYSLIIILHKITAIPIAFLNKFLVPILASIYLPMTLWQVFKKWLGSKTASLFLTLALLIVSFPFLIITTPQSLAYLLLLLIIFLGLICKNNYDLTVIFILSLFAIACHPIAGIQAILFSFLLAIYHSDKKNLKTYFYTFIFIVSSISLPLAFNLFGGEKNASPSAILNFSWLKLMIPGRENFIINFVYLYGFNLKIIVGLIALTGIIIAYRHKEECKISFIYLIISASLGVAYLLTKKLSFLFLINYERDNYSDRILLLIAFFLAPFIVIALYAFLNKLLKQINPIKIPFFIFIIILITTSLYLSYPRHDRYFYSHGFSTGQNDIDAVHWIENNANQDYIVLANQQVSAAALREFGFKKYYKNNIFYYPVPTGGPLYQYYLDMVYKKPSRETMLKAMDLAETSAGYFILNKYWEDFEKVLAEAKTEASAWKEIGQGDIYIFKYLK